MGIKTNDSSKILSGEIQEFLFDDLGYSVDWTLRMKYLLVDGASKRVLYQAVKDTQRKTNKFANPFGALNETIKLNVEQLIDDPEFIQKIR